MEKLGEDSVLFLRDAVGDGAFKEESRGKSTGIRGQRYGNMERRLESGAETASRDFYSVTAMLCS